MRSPFLIRSASLATTERTVEPVPNPTIWPSLTYSTAASAAIFLSVPWSISPLPFASGCRRTLLECHQRLPRPQQLGHGPGLRDAPARREGGIAVEDLAKGPESVRLEMADHRLQKRLRADRIAIHFEMRRDKRAQQPAPDRALVIGRVAAALVPAVLTHVRWVSWRQTPQPIRRQEVTGADVHDGPLPVLPKGTGRQRHCENLIRPQGRIVPVRPVQHVIAVAQGIAPEPVEPGLRASGQLVILTSRLLGDAGERRHGP